MLKSWNGIGFYCTLTGSEGVTVFVDTRGGNVEARGQIKPGSYEISITGFIPRRWLTALSRRSIPHQRVARMV
jgi:hypothetical protein